MSEIRKGLVLIGTIALMFTCACNPQEPLVESIDSTSAAVLGAVLTLSGEPVAQARVEIGEASTITGTDGRFELANLPQDQELDLFVRSSGHSTGHWPLRLADRQQLQLTLRVLEATEHQVDASSGGRIERDDGVVIDLAAGFVDGSGEPVTGPVTVHSAAIRSPLQMRTAPGGMLAITDEGEVALESFGMVEVRLTAGGAAVQPVSPARLELPLPASSRFVEGERIPFWSLDEAQGRWVPEGEGEVFGGTVVAEVDHFTWWNPDVPIRTACIRGRLITAQGGSVTGQVAGEGIDYLGTSYTYTGDDGSFEMLVQTSSQVVLTEGGPLDGQESTFGFRLEIDTPDTPADEGTCGELGDITVSDLTVDDDGDGFTELAGDCDDGDPARHPGAEELCNYVDEDCNGVAEQGPDADHDGEGTCLDCDDDDWFVNTLAADVCDGIEDNNCDGVTDDREADLDADGMTWCDGDCDDSNPALTDGCAWRGLTAGADFTCGIRPAGDVFCWGGVDAALAPAGPFVELGGGEGFACGLLEAGGVSCWNGEMTWSPAELTQARTDLAVGATHECALDVGGTALCAGGNEYGQALPPGLALTDLAAGALHSCGLSEEGTASCWGANAAGQTTVPMGLELAAISAGSIHTCGLDAAGTATCWGDDSFGQLHVDDAVLTSLSAGTHHTCGVTERGTLSCWGRDEHGQAQPPAGRFSAVFAGGSHSCAIDLRGQAVCWGSDEAGQSSVP